MINSFIELIVLFVCLRHNRPKIATGGSCDEGEECDNILDDLENIDDELDETGIIFVTTEDTTTAKKYGIKRFPTLAFFRNKDPLIYTGDLDDEDEVLSWITDEDTLEIPGKIEEVNARMLENILDENDYVVVFFCTLIRQTHYCTYIHCFILID